MGITLGLHMDGVVVMCLRMRMIVEAFIDTLEAGLKEEGQCVVSTPTVANVKQGMRN